LKAAQIIHSLAPGGAERVVCNLATGLRAFGISSAVFCLGQGGLYEESVDKAGIELRTLGKTSKWKGPAVIRRLAALLKKEKIQIMHAHNFSAGLYGRIAAALAGTPVRIMTFHSYTSRHSRFHSRLNRMLYPSTHCVVTVSRFVARGLAEQYPGWDTDRIRLIYNGLDMGGFSTLSGEARNRRKKRIGLDPGQTVVGTVANLTDVKNHAMLLDAAAAVIRKRQDVCFLLVGGGALEKTLKDRARGLGISDHIVFSGVQRDVFLYLGAMDLFVLSSRREGLPMSLLEAMACGLPVVATAVGGIPEAAVEGKTGLLCREGDAPDLAEKILEALSDAERRAAWGSEARARVTEMFSCEKMCRQTADLYREFYETMEDRPV